MVYQSSSLNIEIENKSQLEYTFSEEANNDASEEDNKLNSVFATFEFKKKDENLPQRANANIFS